MDMIGHSLLLVMPEEVGFLSTLAEHHLDLSELKIDTIIQSLASGAHKSNTGELEASR